MYRGLSRLVIIASNAVAHMDGPEPLVDEENTVYNGVHGARNAIMMT